MLQFGIYVHKVLPCFKREKNAHYEITKQFFTALKWLIPLPSLLFLRVLTTLNAFEMERENTAPLKVWNSHQNKIELIFFVSVLCYCRFVRAQKKVHPVICAAGKRNNSPSQRMLIAMDAVEIILRIPYYYWFMTFYFISVLQCHFSALVYHSGRSGAVAVVVVDVVFFSRLLSTLTHGHNIHYIVRLLCVKWTRAFLNYCFAHATYFWWIRLRLKALLLQPLGLYAWIFMIICAN